MWIQIIIEVTKVIWVWAVLEATYGGDDHTQHYADCEPFYCE